MTKKSRSILLVVSLIAVCLALAGATYAFLSQATDPVTNTFEPGELDVSIPEEFEETDDGWKKEVAVTNDNDNGENPNAVSCYVRVAVVPAYAGQMCTVSLNGDDMTLTTAAGKSITINLCGVDQYWFEQDGFFYYKKLLPPGETTELLMDKVTGSAEGFDWDLLTIDILADTVSAGGVDPVVDVWPVAFDGDTTNIIAA